MARTVVDTSVWISAFNYAGIPLAALYSATEMTQMIYCDEIVAEISRVLRDKFGWLPDNIAAALEPYLEKGLKVRITGTLKCGCRDAKGDIILECALLGGASIIVTGDKDLTEMGDFRGIRIIKPHDYLNSLEISET